MPTLDMRSSNQGQADERPYAWRLGIHNLYKNAAPFLHVMTRASKQIVSDAEFRHFEKTFPKQTLRVDDGSNIAAGVTVITVDSGDAFKVRKDHIILVGRTLERMRVTADPSVSTSINVERSIGTTAAAQINDDDYLQVIGTAHAEGDPVPTAVWYDPTKITGACQIFRNPTDQTETARRTDMRTGPISKEARREALQLHEIDKERAFIWGEYFVTASGNDVRRGSTGMIEKVTTNAVDFSEVVTKSAVNSALADLFEDGSEERLTLMGKASMLTWWNMAEAFAWEIFDRTEASFGIKLQEMVTPFGSLMLKHDKLLTKTEGFSDWAILVDPENVGYRFVKGRDTELLQKRQNPGDDRVIDEYLGECGLEVMHQETHGVFKNMAAFAG